MSKPADIPFLATTAGSAAAVGFALGLWLGLPAYLSQPRAESDPALTRLVDPNLARYRQMIAAEGVDPNPHIVAADYAPVSPISSARGPMDDEPVWGADFASEMATAAVTAPLSDIDGDHGWAAGPPPRLGGDSSDDAVRIEPVAGAPVTWVPLR